MTVFTPGEGHRYQTARNTSDVKARYVLVEYLKSVKKASPELTALRSSVKEYRVMRRFKHRFLNDRNVLLRYREEGANDYMTILNDLLWPTVGSHRFDFWSSSDYDIERLADKITALPEDDWGVWISRYTQEYSGSPDQNEQARRVRERAARDRMAVEVLYSIVETVTIEVISDGNMPITVDDDRQIYSNTNPEATKLKVSEEAIRAGVTLHALKIPSPDAAKVAVKITNELSNRKVTLNSTGGYAKKIKSEKSLEIMETETSEDITLGVVDLVKDPVV